MVRNKFGGNKHKKKANKSNSAAPRGLRLKDSDDQEYAKVGKPLGSSRFKLVVYSDGSEKIGTVCGSMHKRVWIREGDVFLSVTGHVTHLKKDLKRLILFININLKKLRNLKEMVN